MLRNRSVQGLPAAWTAISCVLVLTAPAAASPGDFSGSHSRAPAAGALHAAPGDRLPEPEHRSLAQQSDSGGSADTAGESEGGDGREEPRPEAADPAEGDSDPFPGSAEPAGPDLTVDEERDLISRGWD